MQTYRTEPLDSPDGHAIPPKSRPRQLELVPPADDDLFPEAAPEKPAEFTHTRCYVCERGYVAVVAPARLCPLCLEDMDKTRQYVARCVDGVLARLEGAQAIWERQRDASPAKDAWARVAAAMVAVAEKRATQAALDATWAKRKAEGGPLAELLSAYERYATDTDQCAAELQRWHRAQAEINTAWMATDV